MDTRLQQRLIAVARRLRSVQLGWSLAAVWGLAALVGWLAIYAARNGQAGVWAASASRELFWWWLAAALGAAAVLVLVVRGRRTDWQSLAQRLEAEFPNLQQRLVTAAELRPSPASGQMSFLQRSVISEALRHDVAHGWQSIVSGSRIATAWSANIPALLCMLLVGWGLWRAPETMEALAALNSKSASPALLPIIQPGDTEIERGSSLIVTAKFESHIPDEVWLVHGPRSKSGDAAEEARIKMRPSLNDPIFAAYLYEVQEAWQYRVEYDAASSPTFKVEVFEFPALVRADAELVFPSYAQQEPKTILDTRRVTAAQGTQLTWKLHLNKPVAAAELIAEGAEPIVLTRAEESADVAGATVMTTTLPMLESQTWNLRLVDADGRTNPLEVTLRTKVLPNDRAKIQLLAGGDARVSPLEEFEVAARISDDFAVDSAGIGYQFGGGEPVEIALPLESTNQRNVTLSKAIDLEALQAEPDQLLSYYVWAEDRGDDGQPRRMVSDMFFAEVRPFEEIFRQGDQAAQDQQQQQQQQQQQPPGDEQTEELLEVQKQIVVATWNVMREAKTDKLLGRSAPDLVTIAESQQTAADLLEEKAAEAQVPGAEEIVARAAESMRSAIEQLMTTSKSLSKTDLGKALAHEQAAYQELLRLQTREHEVVRSQQQRGSQSRSQRSQARQQQLEQLELNDERNRYENERLAQDQQSQEQSELRQVISRLRELAARQEDINQQLREVQAALQAAETEQQREELQRQLERLREQQQQLLADADELNQRLESQSNETLQQAQQQMEQARQNIQQSNEALRQGNTGQALAAGTRAEQELKELQDEVRQQAANQFQDSMQDMQQQASELQQRQQQVVEQMKGRSDEPSAGLRGDATEQNAAEQLRQQQAGLSELLEDMQQMVTEAEEAEPLLAQKLYDSYRRTQQEKTLESLRVSEQLVERNLPAQAQQLATAVEEDLNKLREEIDEAAEAVLGSEVESLRLALGQLDTLDRQLTDEMQAGQGEQPGQSLANSPVGQNSQPSTTESATESGQQQSGQQQSGEQQSGEQQTAQQQPGQPQTGQQQPGEPQSGQQTSEQQQQPGQQQQQTGQQQTGQQQTGQQQQQQQQQQSEQQQSEQQQSGQQQSGQQQSGQQQSGQQQSGQQPGQSQSGQPQSGQRQPGQQPAGQATNRQPGLRGGADNNGGNPATGPAIRQAFDDASANPITGDGFRAWSDRLRDVEELVNDPELRWQATEIRQAARELRTDWKKHAADPKWADVEDMVAKPLRELKRKVADELVRRAAEKTEIVPMDRDPVPGEFVRGVRSYFENLGSGR